MRRKHDRVVIVRLPLRRARKLLSLARNGWDDVWITDNVYSNFLGIKALEDLRKAITRVTGRRKE
jgi:hypothetical protein